VLRSGSDIREHMIRNLCGSRILKEFVEAFQPDEAVKILLGFIAYDIDGKTQRAYLHLRTHIFERIK